MKVLVLEGAVGAADDAVAQLAAAGHDVARCHEPGDNDFACAGMKEGHACPLETEVISAAIVVRSADQDVPQAGEDGVRCVLRRHLPLVVVGTDEAPYADWAAATVGADNGLVDAVESAAAAPLARHSAAATQALREVLDTHDLPDVTADAVVERRGRDLHVTLRPSAEVPTIVNEMASVRAAGAIRAFDPHPSTIDVTLEVTP